MDMKRIGAIALVFAFAPVSWALAQSSSLFKAHQARQTVSRSLTTRPAPNGAIRTNAGAISNGAGTMQPVAPMGQMTPINAGQTPTVRNPALAQASLISTPAPQPKVIKVNDLIGVIVRHRYRAQIDARMQQDNQWDLESKLDAWFRIHDKKWEQQGFAGGTPEAKFSHSSQLENQGRTNRKDVLETRMQGKVIDVKPNGNLIVVAYYSISSDHDTQSLVLSGEVNQGDLSPDNSVTSDKIFGLKIGSAPTGAVMDATKRGWLKELVDKVRPF
ncbi:MAG TPA: flagellar basal body L-ring protein FlgH [Phycisphaerae bacterium]|nr:flagellar basal body L-ring protein FlgH [Phycisphaerae bacterium]HRW54108.1 flagellar basal body L-ring protein FlgH [Phycisphaerae bacterium]